MKNLYQLRSFPLKIRGKKSQIDLNYKSDLIVHKSKKAEGFTHGLIKASAEFPYNSLNSTQAAGNIGDYMSPSSCLWGKKNLASHDHQTKVLSFKFIGLPWNQSLGPGKTL